MQSVDQNVLLFFAEHRVEWLSFFMVVITYFGNYFFTLAVAAISSLYLIIHHHYKKVLQLLVIFFGSSLTVLILKNWVDRARPENWAFYTEHSPAFPSSHAAVAVALYGFLVYLIYQNKPRFWSKVLSGLLVLLIIMIGLSRLYLGVHYLSDVLGGYAIGLIWLCFVRRIAKSKTSPLRDLKRQE